jgi:hypothetical protein
MEVDSYRPTQYKGVRVDEHPTKVSVEKNKQQTFSMDTAIEERLRRREDSCSPARMEQVLGSHWLERT